MEDASLAGSVESVCMSRYGCNVYVRDFNYRECRAWGDPHFTTWDHPSAGYSLDAHTHHYQAGTTDGQYYMVTACAGPPTTVILSASTSLPLETST